MIGVSLTDGMVTRRHESCSVSKAEAARGGTKAVGKQDLRLPHLIKMDTGQKRWCDDRNAVLRTMTTDNEDGEDAGYGCRRWMTIMSNEDDVRW